MSELNLDGLLFGNSKRMKKLYNLKKKKSMNNHISNTYLLVLYFLRKIRDER